MSITPFGSPVLPELKLICRIFSGVSFLFQSGQCEGSCFVSCFISSIKILGKPKSRRDNGEYFPRNMSFGFVDSIIFVRNESLELKSRGTIITPKPAHAKKIVTQSGLFGAQSIILSPFFRLFFWSKFAMVWVVDRMSV